MVCCISVIMSYFQIYITVVYIQSHVNFHFLYMSCHLFFTVLYFRKLYYFVLSLVIFKYIGLRTLLRFIVLYYIALCFINFYNALMHCIILCCFILHYIRLFCLLKITLNILIFPLPYIRTHLHTHIDICVCARCFKVGMYLHVFIIETTLQTRITPIYHGYTMLHNATQCYTYPPAIKHIETENPPFIRDVPFQSSI